MRVISTLSQLEPTINIRLARSAIIQVPRNQRPLPFKVDGEFIGRISRSTPSENITVAARGNFLGARAVGLTALTDCGKVVGTPMVHKATLGRDHR